MEEQKVESEQSNETTAQETSAEGGKKGQGKGLLLLLIILILLLFVSLFAGGYVAYKAGWIGNSTETASSKDQDDEENQDQDVEETEDDEESSNDEEEDQSEGDEEEEPQFANIEEELNCINIYGSEYVFSFSYPENVGFEINDPWVEEDQCEVTFTYLSGTMVVTTDQGEGYPFNFEEDDYIVIGEVLSQGYPGSGSEEEYMVDLIRMDSNEIGDYPDEGDYYRYQYGNLSSDCSPSELIPDLREPCGSGLHPSAPGARAVSIAVPTAEADEEELAEILEIFDQIAHSFYSYSITPPGY